MSKLNLSPQFTITVSAIDNRERIEIFLVRQFRNYTVFRMQRMIAGGAVEIRNRISRVGERVRSGDEVLVRLVEPPDKLYEAEDLPLDIIYEDPWLIVLEKSPSMVCHPVSGHQTGTICNALQAHFDRQTLFRGILRPGIVHRLDRQTSGLLVVSKTHFSHRSLMTQFENSEVRKEYLAIANGVLDSDRGEIVLPIGRSVNNRMLASVDISARKKRLAQTDYSVEKRFPRQTLVKVTPKTGRMHQIRIHFASIGHPLVGDFLYGDSRDPFGGSEWSTGELIEMDSTKRHLLHASLLNFQHPVFHRPMKFQSAIPDEMQDDLDAAKLTSICHRAMI